MGGNTQSKHSYAVVSSLQGLRKSMEDDHCVQEPLQNIDGWDYYSVFDGHNGSLAAQYCAKQMHVNISAFLKVAYKQYYQTNLLQSGDRRPSRPSLNPPKPSPLSPIGEVSSPPSTSSLADASNDPDARSNISTPSPATAWLQNASPMEATDAPDGLPSTLIFQALKCAFVRTDAALLGYLDSDSDDGKDDNNDDDDDNDGEDAEASRRKKEERDERRKHRKASLRYRASHSNSINPPSTTENTSNTTKTGNSTNSGAVNSPASSTSGVLGDMPLVLEEADAVLDDGLSTRERNEASTAGTTALVVMIHRATGRVVVAHAGDSRCVWMRRDGTAKQLTVDHKPDAPLEHHRIIAAGHTVNHGRLNEVLGVSRSIGLAAWKHQESQLPLYKRALTPVPDVKEVLLKPPLWVLANIGKQQSPVKEEKKHRLLPLLRSYSGADSSNTPSGLAMGLKHAQSSPLLSTLQQQSPGPSGSPTPHSHVPATSLSGNNGLSLAIPHAQSHPQGLGHPPLPPRSRIPCNLDAVPSPTMLQLRSLHALVLACDGLWDVVTCQEAADYINWRFRCHIRACAVAVRTYLAKHGIVPTTVPADIWLCLQLGPHPDDICCNTTDFKKYMEGERARENERARIRAENAAAGIHICTPPPRFKKRGADANNPNTSGSGFFSGSNMSGSESADSSRQVSTRPLSSGAFRNKNDPDADIPFVMNGETNELISGTGEDVQHSLQEPLSSVQTSRGSQESPRSNVPATPPSPHAQAPQRKVGNVGAKDGEAFSDHYDTNVTIVGDARDKMKKMIANTVATPIKEEKKKESKLSLLNLFRRHSDKDKDSRPPQIPDNNSNLIAMGAVASVPVEVDSPVPLNPVSIARTASGSSAGSHAPDQTVCSPAAVLNCPIVKSCLQPLDLTSDAAKARVGNLVNPVDPFLSLPEQFALESLTHAMAQRAIDRGSRDNVTVMLVLLDIVPVLGRASVKAFAKDRLQLARTMLAQRKTERVAQSKTLPLSRTNSSNIRTGAQGPEQAVIANAPMGVSAVGSGSSRGDYTGIGSDCNNVCQISQLGLHVGSIDLSIAAAHAHAYIYAPPKAVVEDFRYGGRGCATVVDDGNEAGAVVAYQSAAQNHVKRVQKATSTDREEVDAPVATVAAEPRPPAQAPAPTQQGQLSASGSRNNSRKDLHALDEPENTVLPVPLALPFSFRAPTNPYVEDVHAEGPPSPGALSTASNTAGGASIIRANTPTKSLHSHGSVTGQPYAPQHNTPVKTGLPPNPSAQYLQQLQMAHQQQQQIQQQQQQYQQQLTASYGPVAGHTLTIPAGSTLAPNRQTQGRSLMNPSPSPSPYSSLNSTNAARYADEVRAMRAQQMGQQQGNLRRIPSSQSVQSMQSLQSLQGAMAAHAMAQPQAQMYIPAQMQAQPMQAPFVTAVAPHPYIHESNSNPPLVRRAHTPSGSRDHDREAEAGSGRSTSHTRHAGAAQSQAGAPQGHVGASHGQHEPHDVAGRQVEAVAVQGQQMMYVPVGTQYGQYVYPQQMQQVPQGYIQQGQYMVPVQMQPGYAYAPAAGVQMQQTMSHTTVVGGSGSSGHSQVPYAASVASSGHSQASSGVAYQPMMYYYMPQAQYMPQQQQQQQQQPQQRR